MDIVYRRLSFEDDLFTARAYKSNYRTSRSQRRRRKEFDLDHKDATNKSDSDNDTINPGGKRRQNNEAFVEKLARRFPGRRSTIDSSAKTAKRIAEENLEQLVAHGIIKTTTISHNHINIKDHVGSSTLEKDGLHD